MRKNYLLFMASLVFCSVCSINNANAQDDDSVTTETAARTERAIHPNFLGLSVGSAGIGLEGGTSLDENFGFRVGFGWAPTFSYDSQNKIGDYYVTTNYKTTFFNIRLLADYYTPFWTKAGFRFTGGIAGFLTAKSEATTVPVGSIYYGDIDINADPERMGNVKSTATRNGMALYIGAGFQDLVNSKHFGLSLDLGTYYSIVSPTTKMETSGYLVGNEVNQAQMKKNLMGYRWLPTLQFGINYKF